MNVNVGLIIFAVNVHNPMNRYVLLKKYDNLYEIPKKALLKTNNSLMIVKEILGEATYIVGNWLEVRYPEQVGFWDGIGQDVFLVHSLIFPDKVDLKEGYEWISIDRLNDVSLYSNHYSVIRYAGGVK